MFLLIFQTAELGARAQTERPVRQRPEGGARRKSRRFRETTDRPGCAKVKTHF